MDPWGTPHVTGAVEDTDLPRLTETWAKTLCNENKWLTLFLL